MKAILSLCDYAGIWSQPYKDAGYLVIKWGLQHGQDIRTQPVPDIPIHGLIAQPPCTHLAGSGARWWAEKGEAALHEGLDLVAHCLKYVALKHPAWWVMENPVGRLSNFIGKAADWYHPYEYTGYGFPDEAYTEKTLLWGHGWNKPPPRPLPPVLGSKCISCRRRPTAPISAVKRRADLLRHGLRRTPRDAFMGRKAVKGKLKKWTDMVHEVRMEPLRPSAVTMYDISDGNPIRLSYSRDPTPL